MKGVEVITRLIIRFLQSIKAFCRNSDRNDDLIQQNEKSFRLYISTFLV
jgi:hypothetical protein